MRTTITIDIKSKNEFTEPELQTIKKDIISWLESVSWVMNSVDVEVKDSHYQLFTLHGFDETGSSSSRTDFLIKDEGGV